MKIDKKVLSFVLVLVLILSSMTALAKVDEKSDIRWMAGPEVRDLKGNKIEIYGVLEVPEDYKGKTKVSLEIDGFNVNLNKDGSFSKSIFKKSEIEIKVFAGKEEITQLNKILLYLEDTSRVDIIDAKILTLPNLNNLTLDDRQQVKEVRLMYEELTDLEKAFVKNIDKLVLTENRIKELAKLLVEEKLEAIPQVINTSKGVNYEEVELALQVVRQAIEIAKEVGWTENEIKSFHHYDKIRGTEVQVMIFRLPRYSEINYVNLEEARPLVKQARQAYDSLTASEKSYIWTTSKLESDEERIIELDFLLALMETTPDTFESLIREYAEGIELDLTSYDSLKDKTPVNEQLAGKNYKPGNGWSGGKYSFRIDFYNAVAMQKEKESVDKTVLAKAIQEGEDLLDTEGATEEALELLISALDEAVRVYLNEDITQVEVDEAVVTLNQAIEEFKDSLIVNNDANVVAEAKAYLIGLNDRGLESNNPTGLSSARIKIRYNSVNDARFSFSEEFEYGEEERTDGYIRVRSRDYEGIPHELEAHRDENNAYTVRVKVLITKGEYSDYLTYEIFVPKAGKRADPISGTPGIPAEPVTFRLL